MPNKNIIKEMFDREFNIEIMKREILLKERRENMNIKKVFKYSIVSICLIGVISVSMLLNKNDLFNKNSYNKNDYNIYINKINEVNNSLDIDGKAEDITLKEVYDFYSKIENITIPSGLKNVRNIKMYSRENLNDDYKILDGYSIMYADEKENRKSIEIFMSETLKEKRRCMSIVDNSYKTSYINETNLTIMSFGDYFIVNFKYENINFDIETRNVSQNELIDLLESIIK